MIGSSQSTFIIAELSGNHHQKFEEAEALVRAAAEAGADAVKSQTYTADTITLKSDKKWFRVGGKDQPGSWRGRTLYDLYTEAHTPWEWLPRLKVLAESLGMVFFTSVFDETAVDFNERMGVELYKIAAYEAVHIPLLEKVAATGKPVIISLGFGDLEEASLALKTLRQGGAAGITALHCLTSYADNPAYQDSNLATIADINQRFKVISGLSDNTGGIVIPIVAVTVAGAAVIEKHLILDRKLEGPDARFSIEPAEFKEMTRVIRQFEAGDTSVIDKYASQSEIKTILGQVHYGPASLREAENVFFRPSIWVKKDIAKCEIFTIKNIRVARPNTGLEPKYFRKILGKKAERDISAASPFSWNFVKKDN